MAHELATRNGHTEAGLARLDPYAGGLADGGARVDALAVISCGYRGEAQGNKPGLPKASRANDARQIHLHDPRGRAPGLLAALELAQHRSLLIAFPLDEPAAFIQQRFARYSASRLEAYGDDQQLTWIDTRQEGKPEHLVYQAGSPEYAKLVKTCKADTRIFFCLAEWGEGGPEVVFPDGLGFYAIRTTSRHSVRSILSTLEYTRRFTKGRLAGLPFVLEVDYREVAGPDGSKRTIPVWCITTRPPQGIRLSSRNFAALASSALEEGSRLMLPAPDADTWESAEEAGPPPVEEPTEAEFRVLQAGGLCDAEVWTKRWHATARGTQFEADDERHLFIDTYTEGEYSSLAAFLAAATEEQATALIVALLDAIEADKQESRAKEYASIYGDTDPFERHTDTVTGEITETPAAPKQEAF